MTNCYWSKVGLNYMSRKYKQEKSIDRGNKINVNELNAILGIISQNDDDLEAINYKPIV